jgi:asparagine synthase (glutamine-hydrolysing)
VCGISGKLLFNQEASVESALLKKMADTIIHRGPDDEGYYHSGQVGFGFRRLAIIDLALGHQPISNEDGSVWLVFNGEIYNYLELRHYLLSKGHVFRTQSDTEVIVHLYEEFGEESVAKLRGMFAFAIWDEKKKTLLLARDRFGIKPLYYWLSKTSLVFGSEIKAILADPETKPEVLPGMVDRFLTFNYVPGEETLFKNISKLAPAHYMIVRDGKVTCKQYWDLRFTPTHTNLQKAEAELSEVLEESVGLHMISDVPVGFLLSGGVDSTAMLGLAVGKTEHPLSSYTLGFSAPGITDERPYARLAAKTYGSEHHEMTISSQDFRDFMPKYVWYMEEPVCEPPAVALYYVSRLASKFVKVLISGEGGDEAFAGYPNYRTMLWMERLKSVFGPMTPFLSSGISLFNRYMIRSDRLGKYIPLLNQPFESYYYSRTSGPLSFFNSKFGDFYSAEFVAQIDKGYSASVVKKYMENGIPRNKLNRMLYIDTKTWLTDDLLLKADKMTMANSVELRVPLLDHKVLEFAASLPENLKVHGLTTKYIAKKTLAKRVPGEILHRKKTGFPVPYSKWMQTDLRDWVSQILLDRETVQRGYFEKKAIENLLDEHVRSGHYPKEVFSLVTLELWHRAFLQKRSSVAVS